jgi:hypothetical protein
MLADALPGRSTCSLMPPTQGELANRDPGPAKVQRTLALNRPPAATSCLSISIRPRLASEVIMVIRPHEVSRRSLTQKLSQGTRDTRCQIVPSSRLPKGPNIALATTRFRAIVKGLSRASARPTGIPQVRAATAFAHRFPTDKTAFPGTRRHAC